jgi:hypothetical protein
MKPSADLKRLIEAAAPYFAAEAEIIGTYFNSSKRDKESDLLWLARQARKEFWDSFDNTERCLFLSPLKKLMANWDRIDSGGFSRHDALEEAETLYEEFSHYVAFADAYDAIKDANDPAITPTMLRDVRMWPENEALHDIRTKHRVEHGDLGMRACYFTEGGYCSLFTEGMKLKGSKANEAIARASLLVYEDEFHHMLRGIAGLDAEGMSAAEWDKLWQLSQEQLKARLRMRNAQFGNVVPETRMQELLAGKARPIQFDYHKAGLAA